MFVERNKYIGSVELTQAQIRVQVSWLPCWCHRPVCHRDRWAVKVRELGGYPKLVGTFADWRAAKSFAFSLENTRLLLAPTVEHPARTL